MSYFERIYVRDSSGTVINPTKIPDSNVIVQDEDLAVPSGAETTVLTYSNPGTTYYLDTVVGSGRYNAEYTVYLGGSLVMKRRTTSAVIDMVQMFPRPLLVTNGTTVDIKVQHFAGSAREFNATIIGYR